MLKKVCFILFTILLTLLWGLTDSNISYAMPEEQGNSVSDGNVSINNEFYPIGYFSGTPAVIGLDENGMITIEIIQGDTGFFIASRWRYCFNFVGATSGVAASISDSFRESGELIIQGITPGVDFLQYEVYDHETRTTKPLTVKVIVHPYSYTTFRLPIEQVIKLSNFSKEVESKFSSAIREQFSAKPKDEYTIVSGIIEWMCLNLEYDYNTYYKEATQVNDGRFGNSPYTEAAILDGLPVCSGYARIFYHFMDICGIDVRMMGGRAYGGRHAWNQVKIDNQWYNLDLVSIDDGDNIYDMDFEDYLVGSYTINEAGTSFSKTHVVSPSLLKCEQEALHDYPVDHYELWKKAMMHHPDYVWDGTGFMYKYADEDDWEWDFDE